MPTRRSPEGPKRTRAQRHARGFLAAICMGLVCGLPGCNRDPADRKAMIPHRTVVVFADAIDWAEIEAPLREIFEEPIETPQMEALYNLRRESPEEFEFFSQFGMLLIVGTHDRVGGALGLVKTQLGLDAVRGEDAWLLTQRDLWAHPQLVGVLNAPNRVQLASRAAVQGPAIRAVYDAFVREVVASTLVYRSQVEEETRVAAETGIQMRIPRRWLLRDYDPELARVAIWKRNPEQDRQLLVQVVPGAAPAGLRERCQVWRNRTVSEVYDGDWIRAEGLRVEETNLAGRWGVRLRGLWENHKHVMGGPFETWCVPLPEHGQTLMIDMAVYAPGESKMEGLRELQTLASLVVFLPLGGGDQ